MVQPLGQFPALYILGIGVHQHQDVLARTIVPTSLLTTLSVQPTPGVAAGYGGQPRAKGAVLCQSIHALKQDGEGQLRDVGGVLPGEPVSSRHGEHKPLVSVEQALPRAEIAAAAVQNEVSV